MNNMDKINAEVSSYTDLTELQRREFICELQHRIIYDRSRFVELVALIESWQKDLVISN